MYTPIGSTVSQPLSLVATQLPNNIAARVPNDNVPPSFSSAQLNNNASGNRTALPKTNTQSSPTAANQEEKFSASTTSNNSGYSSSTQSAFLAQLASGDISPEVRGIFIQYEKLLSYANVKYKPSNAGKPVEPVSMFSTLIKLDKTEARPEPAPTVDNIEIENKITNTAQDIPVTIENLPAQEPVMVNVAALAQMQAAKYSETVARNNTPSLNDLDIA